MEHQKEALAIDPYRTGARFKTLVWHRRARKTTTAIYHLVRLAHKIRGVFWHLFPTYQEASTAIYKDPNMLFSIIPPELIAKKNDSELAVYFHNGSIYRLLGQDNPDYLRGAGPIAGVSDEFDLHKPETWQILEPIVRANGGSWWFVGTPKGRGKLYDFYMRGQSGDPEWKSWLLRGDQSGLFKNQELESMKISMTQSMFQQEIMCDFLENEGVVFRGVRQAMISKPEPPKDQHLYIIGADLAKVTDYTVLTVYDRMNNNQVFQDRFQTLEWPFQKAKIQAIAKHYNNALVKIDATGLGDPIADDLVRSGVAVEPFKITEQSKKDIIEKLSIWIEQRKCTLLPIEESLTEFDNFSYEIGPTGKIRYQAREGFHDDIVISHALAISGLAEVYKRQPTPDDNIIQRAYKNAVRGISNHDADQDQW